jgi:hypothetical protein
MWLQSDHIPLWTSTGISARTEENKKLCEAQKEALASRQHGNKWLKAMERSRSWKRIGARRRRCLATLATVLGCCWSAAGSWLPSAIHGLGPRRRMWLDPGGPHGGVTSGESDWLPWPRDPGQSRSLQFYGPAYPRLPGPAALVVLLLHAMHHELYQCSVIIPWPEITFCPPFEAYCSTVLSC